MALFFPDDNSPEARTHALVIGVGGYHHLQEGVDEKDPVVEHVGLLAQLTSPPRSALAFATWLQDHAQRLRAPLGSVELLLSVASSDDLQLPAGIGPGATRADIAAAYGRWRERCERNEENVAVFFFCGHGLEKSEQYLLAEDFGANPLNPWEGSFGIDSTRLAFNACRARTQCFFIDACRKITSEMLKKEPMTTGLEIFDHTVPEREYNLTAKAAAKNEEAFGPQKGISYFTQALLRALNGAAAQQSDQGWVVETGAIANHITKILRMTGGVGRCACTVADSTPLVHTDAPIIPVLLGCLPEAANAVARLSWESIDGTSAVIEQIGGPWRFETTPGFYRASARFDQPTFRQAEARVLAIPPAASSSLRCEP